jgi:hypothetical protein
MAAPLASHWLPKKRNALQVSFCPPHRARATNGLAPRGPFLGKELAAAVKVTLAAAAPCIRVLGFATEGT